MMDSLVPVNPLLSTFSCRVHKIDRDIAGILDIRDPASQLAMGYTLAIETGFELESQSGILGLVD